MPKKQSGSNPKKGSSRKVGRGKRKIQRKGSPISAYVRGRTSFEQYVKAVRTA